jgi:hypothetical protein
VPAHTTTLCMLHSPTARAPELPREYTVSIPREYPEDPVSTHSLVRCAARHSGRRGKARPQRRRRDRRRVSAAVAAAAAAALVCLFARVLVCLLPGGCSPRFKRGLYVCMDVHIYIYICYIVAVARRVRSAPPERRVYKDTRGGGGSTARRRPISFTDASAGSDNNSPASTYIYALRALPAREGAPVRGLPFGAGPAASAAPATRATRARRAFPARPATPACPATTAFPVRTL